MPRDPKLRSTADALSDVLFFGMYAGVLLVFSVPFSWGFVWLAIGSYLIRMGAVTAGYHRYFAHRSYKTSRGLQFALALIGSAAMQNGPIWWASVHRHHHRHSDHPDDAHSPVQRGFFYAHMGWIFDRSRRWTDYSNVRDLMQYPELRWLDRHHWLPLIAWALGCYKIAGWPGVIWGFVVSTVAVQQATMCINSLAHIWGSRRFPTKDDSRNNAFLAFLTLGEGWHNNHHACMTSARQGLLWWEIDLSYYGLCVLEKLGFIWDVRRPRPDLSN